MSASDLCTPGLVETFAGAIANNVPKVGQLIASTSDQILRELCRQSVLPYAYTETHMGHRSKAIMLREWPVSSVSSVIIDGQLIPQAAVNAVGVTPGNGWYLDPPDPWPPGRPQMLRFRGYWSCRSESWATIAYTAGYQTTEAWTVPSSHVVTVKQQAGAWGSDVGVTYANGTALTAMPVGSTLSTGQYTANEGVYQFATGDASAAMLISYGFIPQALAQACAEWVAYIIQSSQRIGLRSQSVGGNETTSFDISEIPARIKRAIWPYARVAQL